MPLHLARHLDGRIRHPAAVLSGRRQRMVDDFQGRLEMKKTFDVQRLRKLAAAGLSQQEIARAMGYHENTICYHARKNGINNQGKVRK